MTSASARKGATAEREAAALIEGLLGFKVRRRRNLGTHDDIGDLLGLPDTTIQVVSRSTDFVNVAVVRKPIEAEQQARNAGTQFAITLARVRGGTWRVILTPEMFCKLYSEAMA